MVLPSIELLVVITIIGLLIALAACRRCRRRARRLAAVLVAGTISNKSAWRFRTTTTCTSNCLPLTFARRAAAVAENDSRPLAMSPSFCRRRVAAAARIRHGDPVRRGGDPWRNAPNHGGGPARTWVTVANTQRRDIIYCPSVSATCVITRSSTDVRRVRSGGELRSIDRLAKRICDLLRRDAQA